MVHVKKKNCLKKLVSREMQFEKKKKKRPGVTSPAFSKLQRTQQLCVVMRNYGDASFSILEHIKMDFIIPMNALQLC